MAPMRNWRRWVKNAVNEVRLGCVRGSWSRLRGSPRCVPLWVLWGSRCRRASLSCHGTMVIDNHGPWSWIAVTRWKLKEVASELKAVRRDHFRAQLAADNQENSPVPAGILSLYRPDFRPEIAAQSSALHETPLPGLPELGQNRSGPQNRFRRQSRMLEPRFRLNQSFSRPCFHFRRARSTRNSLPTQWRQRGLDAWPVTTKRGDTTSRTNSLLVCALTQTQHCRHREARWISQRWPCDRAKTPGRARSTNAISARNRPHESRHERTALKKAPLRAPVRHHELADWP